MEIINQSLPVSEFLSSAAESLGLRQANDLRRSAQDITLAEVSRPGFVLTGFTEKYAHERIQILGGAEFTFLERLAPELLEDVSQMVVSEQDGHPGKKGVPALCNGIVDILEEEQFHQ